ncbi:DUF3667 domain-containing protein [Pseudofulvibacter geojedonensis]|uniref:DUF3667 domain-containing protein n=1 Tax=Pseudofulvibacter geojedonensis TaxID=1123758 RepID=A0ABW3I2J8_9FLAO
MNCKNCAATLSTEDLFCNKCGAKVVIEKITLRKLITEVVSNVFGFDSKYFRTLKMMVVSPKIVLSEYLSGVRKKYVNPFAFLAIGTALSLLVFNLFPDSFIEIQSSMGGEQFSELRELAERDLTAIEGISEKELQQLKIQQDSARFQLNFQEKWLKYFLKYFNILTFVFLLFYALLSKWTYRKSYNLGEHMVINAFIQGVTMWFTVIAFFLSMFISPIIYTLSPVLMLLFYWYALSKLHDHSIVKSIIKLLRFIVLTTIMFLLIFIIGTIVGIIVVFVSKAM